MSLYKQLHVDMVAARKNRTATDQLVLTVLLSEAEKNYGKFENGQKFVEDADVVTTVKKMLKNLDLLATYADNSKIQQIERERAVLNRYVPKQMSETELQTFVDDNLSEKAKSIGPVMGAAKKKLEAGTYDTALLSKIAKETLESRKS